MNAHDRIHAALTGGMADQVPFTIYRQMVPKGEAERRLREKGLGFWWRANVISWEHPNCDIREIVYSKEGRRFQRAVYSTPLGEVSSLHRLGGLYGSSWQMEWPVKTRDDYRVMEYVANDAKPVECFDEFEKVAHDLGGDGFPVANYMYTPLQSLVVSLVGFEQAAYHMVDYPDEFWSLHDALNKRNRRGYTVLAGGPHLMQLYGGNCHPGILGRERFAKYVAPCYDEMADILHEEGKLVGVHLDADNAAWKDIVGATKVDVIEAFTPPPDCDLPVDEAREVWPDKVLSLNFPSSLHLAEPGRIREATVEILRQAGDGRRLIMGITEDIPEDRWEISLNAIADALNEFGRLPLRL